MKKVVFVLLVLILFSGSAFASQEGVLSFASFVFHSNGIGESGPVIVSGDKNGQNEIISLDIKAFGKQYSVSKEQLMDMPRLPYNGMQVSYEQGYKKLGGKTIYVSLQVGFTSNVSDKILLILHENGKIRIEK